MPKIIHLHETKQFQSKQYNHFIDDNLHHSDPDVQSLWRNLSKSTMEKYPGIPEPALLELKLNKTLTPQDEALLSENVTEYLHDYIEQVRYIMLEMISDIILLQRDIAEQQIEIE